MLVLTIGTDVVDGTLRCSIRSIRPWPTPIHRAGRVEPESRAAGPASKEDAMPDHIYRLIMRRLVRLFDRNGSRRFADGAEYQSVSESPSCRGRRRAPGRAHLLPMDAGPGSAWVGRLDADVGDARGRILGRVVLVVDRDTVCVFFKNKSVASTPRNGLRRWLIHPVAPLEVDDIRWSVQGTDRVLALGDRGVFRLPESFVDELCAVI